MKMEESLKKLKELADKGFEIHDGDYVGDDGLLYCGKCHTRRQTRLTLSDGQVFEPLCMCKCEEARLEQEEQERKQRERLYKIQSYKRSGFPDDELRSCTFERDDTPESKASKVCHNYVDNFNAFRQKGKGLMLFGDVGTGKTFLASCIANALIDEMHPCLVTNFSRIINTLSGMFEGKQQYIDRLNDYEVLIIDDLATERKTEYVNEIVYSIIDSRYRSGKPLIITTNFSPMDMQNEQDINRRRIYSRIGEMCIPVEVKGKDRRKAMPDGDLLKLLFK